jgi:hypothetical protein
MTPGEVSVKAAFKCIAIAFLAGCSSVIEMPAPIAYPGACPEGNYLCQRNFDAQTLAYIGQPEAAMLLMCTDDDLAHLMQEACEISLPLY